MAILAQRGLNGGGYSSAPAIAKSGGAKAAELAKGCEGVATAAGDLSSKQVRHTGRDIGSCAECSRDLKQQWPEMTPSV
eukprot:CAMPEP_0180641086 /NCGR_PEP_ID=MMETSP1037_2-20121125/46263_1 /TAXON_ID=632150 /ORGANISM="Azadinium spinosum, Strain 3D9" /LENGTH=78 /DNA_ID=CAMNT_0022663843 /DNA_START=246 /DNA_END=481 /DNA_ORIENTATION=+